MKRTSTLLVRSLMSASVVLAGVSLASAQAVTVDGNRDNLYGFPRVWQTVQTGYGDNSDASATGANGSELVAAYSYIGGGNLNLFFSGNLQNGGNKIFVFLDTDSGNGQNRLRGDNTGIAALLRLGDSGGPNGLIFESGFTADHAFVMNADGTSLFVDYSPLPTGTGGTASYLGASALGGGAGGLGGGSNFLFAQACLHNGNTAGVGGGSASGQIPTMPTTGLEMSIPLSALGTINQSVKVFAFISNDTGAFLSNQFLPDVGANGGTVGNFNEPRGINFAAAGNPGTQFFYVQPRTRTELWMTQVGSAGATATVSTASAVRVMSANAMGVGQSPTEIIAFPSVGSSPILTARNSTVFDSYLRRSTDGNFVSIGGLEAQLNSSTPTQSANSRTVATIDANLTTLYNPFSFSSNIIRGVAQFDAAYQFLATNTGAFGIPYPAGTFASRHGGNLRSLQIANNRLQSLQAATVNAAPLIPFTSSTTASTFITTSQLTDCHDFVVGDSRTVYLTSTSGTNALQKLVYNGTTWISQWVATASAIGGNARGLAVRTDGSGQNILYFAVTDGSVRSVVDTGAAPTSSTIVSTGSTAGVLTIGLDWSPRRWQTPTATTDIGTTDQNVTLNVPAPGLLGNDTGEVVGGAELVGALTPPSAGAVTVNPDGSYQFVPANGFTGNASFTYRFTDGDTFSAPATVNLTVNAVNEPPVLGAIGNQSVDELATLTLNLSANDPNNDTLTYSADSLPVGATLIGNVFSWTPTEAQGPASVPITFTVDDGNGGTDTEAITITVNEVNAAPTLAAISNQTVEAEQLLTFPTVGDDPNDVPENGLTYTLQGVVPAGASIDPSTGVFTWTPTEAQGGQDYTLTVRVTDDGTPNLFAEQNVLITVAAGNAAPVITWPQNHMAETGAAFTLDIDATDADLPDDELTFSLEYAPSGATINPVTGEFTWTPVNGGNFVVLVRATDSEGLFDEKQFSITAGSPNTRVKAWGQNNVGQLGDGTGLTRLSPVSAVGLTQAVAVASGGTHSLALLSDGTLRAWGDNQDSQLGGGVSTQSFVPLVVSGGLTNVVAIAAGDYHSLALLSDGTVRAWGRNSSGELGDGTTTRRAVPTLVGGLTEVVAIEAGDAYSVALLSDGTVKAWGFNSAGNLGDGTTFTRIQPTPVSGLVDAVGVAAGKAHTLALLRDGTGMGWGRNDQGQLGDNTLTNRLVPTPVSTLTGATSVAAGTSHSLAVRSDGSMVAWGQNTFGQIGDGTSIRRTLPTVVPGISTARISSGDWLTNHVVLQDGSVRGWGYNALGEIGDGTTTTRFVPTLVPGLTNTISVSSGNLHSLALVLDPPIITPVINQTVNELVNLNFVISATNGTAPRVFSLDAGSLAKGMTIDSSTGAFSWTPSEAQNGVHDVTVSVTDANDITDSDTFSVTVNEVNSAPTLAAIGNQTVEAGQLLTFPTFGDDPNDIPENGLTYSLIGAPTGAAIDANTGAFTWTPSLAQGPQVYNFTVRVTDDGTPNLFADQPVQITVSVPNADPVLAEIGDKSVYEDQLLTFDASATDPDAGQTLTYSLDSGAPYGAYINPANGQFTFRPAPIQTPNSFSVTVIVEDGNGGTDSETITINAQRETRTANPLIGWGYNGTGALALNDQVDRSSPTVIPALTGASRIFGVGYNAFARDPLGGWHGWGFNFFGQLGNGRFDVPNVLVPETLPNLAGIIDLGGGEYHSIGLLSDGTFKGWGINQNGQLGLGFTSLGQNVPQVIPGVSGGFGMAKGIGSAYSHLLLGTGAGFAMGRNDVGQLGIGSSGANQLSPMMSTLSADVRSIASGTNHVIALRNDLTVWTTGHNSFGQLGNGNFVGQDSFTQVVGLSDVVRVSAGKEASYAVRRDGTVWAWGRNLLGKLGDGTTVTSNVPVQVSGLTNVKEVFATEESVIALKTDGTVWAWGSNQYGLLGDGTVGGSSTVPVQVPGLVDIDRVRTIGNAVFAWKYGLPNAAPVAVDDVYAATEDQVLTVNAAAGVIANDTDDQPISVLRASLVSAPNPAQGSVVLNLDGSFTFTPAANFNGVATFTYKVDDWQLDSNTATVTINVGAENDAPTLSAIGALAVNEFQTINFFAVGFDVDGPSLTYSLSGEPAGSTINPITGQFFWTPTEAQGPGVFNFTISVSDGSLSASTPVQITVVDVNENPTLAAIGGKSVDEQTLLTFSISASDNDLPANTLSYSASGLPPGATFVGDTFSWTPSEAQGPGSFDVTFTVSDGAGGTDSEVVTIAVNEVNTAPVADNQMVNATEDTPKSVLLTASDAENDPLTWSNNQPSHGVVTGVAPNLTYTPNPDFAGTDSFTFTVNDGLENSNVGTVTINVEDVLDMDVTVIGSIAPNGFGSPSFDAYAARAMASLENNPGVDDGDRSLDPTAYDAVTTIPWYDNAATGTPFWMGVQNPAAPFNLELGHRIHFGVRFLGKGTRFSISQLDFEWSSSDDNSLGFTDTWSAADVYSTNRRGIDYGTDRVKGTSDDIIITSGPADQMVDELIYVGYGNAWDVTQEPGATVADQLASLRCYLEQEAPIVIQGTYKVRDGLGGFLGQGTGTVTLMPTNNLPVAGNQMVSVDEDSSVGITLGAVDTDPFEAPLGYSVVDGPTHGTLSGTAPNLTYTPNANYFGPDSFTFIATDCVGDSNLATVTISVVSVNDEPVLDPIGGRVVNELEPLTITLASSDIDGGSAIYTATNMPVGASLGGNAFQWTPSEVQGPGSYDITFTVSDGNGGFDEETITVVVNEVNVAPELDPIGDRTVDEMSQLAFTAVGTDSDLPANTLTYSLVGAPAGASIHPTSGVFTWTPAEDQGPDSFTFTVRVSDGTLTDEEEITVSVAEVNVTPELAAIGDKSIDELAPLTFTASATDSDLPANTLTYSLVNAPAGATIDGTTGAFTWTPTEAQGPSSYTFTVRVSDGDLVDEEEITVTVAEVNTPPVANAQTLGTGINQPLNITLTGSDTDIPVQTLTYQVVSQPTNGVLSGVEPNMVYTPNPGYSGPDSFTFKANDGVEDSNVETITINVSGLAILLDLQFEGFQSAAPVTRGVSITFGGLSGAGNLPVTLDRDLVISETGQASLVLTNADIPNLQANEGNYGISVKDNLHTLRTTQQLTWTGTGYSGTISLRGGNLNKDGKIDIGDYIVYAVRIGGPVSPSTPLALQVDPSFRHADISGDGVVDSIDFSFISAGFGSQYDDPLVGEYGRGDDPIRTRITVADAIRESGSKDAVRMDLNRDGWISLAEIQTYLTKR